MDDWATRLVDSIVDKHGEYHGWPIVEQHLRKARADALEEAARMVESGLGDHFTAGHIRGLKDLK